MAIRTAVSSLGVQIDTYICAECKTEEQASGYGVRYSETAVNSIPPHGWLTEIQRDFSRRPVAVHFCPRCAVAPEYR